MELKQYLTTLKDNFLFIVISALIGSLIAFLTTSNLPSGFRTEQLFYIANTSVKSDNPQDYYYAQEIARNLTDTAVAIISSPDFTNEVTQKAASISAKKIAPQIIKVTVVANNPQSTQNLLEKTMPYLNQKLSSLTGQNSTLQIKPLGKNSSPLATSMNSKLVLSFGFIIGLTFSLLVIGLKTYFKL